MTSVGRWSKTHEGGEELTRRGGWALGAKGEEVTRKVRVSITSFVYAAFLAPNSLSLQMRMSSFLLVQGGYFHRGDFLLLSGGQRKVRVPSLHWLFLK